MASMSSFLYKKYIFIPVYSNNTKHTIYSNLANICQLQVATRRKRTIKSIKTN